MTEATKQQPSTAGTSNTATRRAFVERLAKAAVVPILMPLILAAPNRALGSP